MGLYGPHQYRGGHSYQSPVCQYHKNVTCVKTPGTKPDTGAKDKNGNVIPCLKEYCAKGHVYNTWAMSNCAGTCNQKVECSESKKVRCLGIMASHIAETKCTAAGGT